MEILSAMGLKPPDGISWNTATLLEMKVDLLNRQEGALPGEYCPLCKNKGYVAKVKDDAVVCVECTCTAKRRSMERLRRSGLMDLMARYSFQRYQTPEAWQQAAKEKALDYVQNGAGRWFVVTGTPGTGKTHLCTAVAAALIQAGKETRYMLWRQDAPRLKALVSEGAEYQREMEALYSVPVLYIDDFFKGGVTEADKNLAFELLNARYNRRCMTLISSEKTVEDMLSIDEAIGSRIYERSRGYCLLMPKQNWRLKP